MESNAQIQDFCRRYFRAVEAPLLVDQPDFLQVQLPRDIDKELTDRPYYWMYIEATGQQVPDTVLSLSFSPELQIEGVEKMEFVTLGSFRLNKLIESAQKRGRFACVYQQQVPPTALRPSPVLVPVLLSTCKWSFVADRRRDEMVSYGINLCTGQLAREVYERVEGLSFGANAPSGVQIAQPRLSFEQGYEQIKQRVLEDIEQLDHTWAEEAEAHLQQELEQLETYYDSLGLVNADEAKSDEEQAKKAALLAAERELRIAELKWRCAPRVQIKPFHFALLFVTEDAFVSTAATGNRLSI